MRGLNSGLLGESNFFILSNKWLCWMKLINDWTIIKLEFWILFVGALSL